MSRNRSDGLLARVDFPLYTVQTLTSRHVLVAGGGGASKTGVANGFVSIHTCIFAQFINTLNCIILRVTGFNHPSSVPFASFVSLILIFWNLIMNFRKYSNYHTMGRGLLLKRWCGMRQEQMWWWTALCARYTLVRTWQRAKRVTVSCTK